MGFHLSVRDLLLVTLSLFPGQLLPVFCVWASPNLERLTTKEEGVGEGGQATFGGLKVANHYSWAFMHSRDQGSGTLMTMLYIRKNKKVGHL